MTVLVLPDLASVMSRELPLRFALLGAGQRAFGLVGVAPHGHQLRRSGSAGVGQAQLEGTPQGLLRGRHGGRRVLGDLLGQVLAATSRSSGGSTTSLRIPSCAGPLGGDALVAADQRHAHDRLHRRVAGQGDGLVRGDLADRHVGVEEGGVDSAAITMSASATKCRPPPAHVPLTAAMTGFHTWLCQAVSLSSASRVRRDCSRSASLSRLSWTTSRPVWKAGPLPVLTITRTSGSASSSSQARSSSASIVASMALPTSGRSKTSQPDRAPPLDHQGLVARGPLADGQLPGHLAPGGVVPRVGLAGQAEDPLAHDVLVDLGGAALDGVGPAAQHALHLVGKVV